MNNKRTLRPLAMASCLALLAACGATGEAETLKTSGELDTIRLLTIPIADFAPIFYGQDAGIFEKHGIELSLDMTAGGGAGIPAMLGGSADMVSAATLSALQAADTGLPIRLVAAAATSLPESESDEDIVAVVSGPGGVSDASELSGARMAVNVGSGLNELFTRAFVEQHGVDPATIQFVELPFPDQPAALTSARIDATMIGPPFLQQLQESGASTLGYPYRVQDRPVVVSSYITSEEYAAENEETLQNFRDALNEIVEAMADPKNHEAVLESLSEATKIPVEKLESILLPNFTPLIDEDSLTETVELATRFEFMKGSPMLDDILLPGSTD
jgi:ABC-type nitrate/sulfonate/bicarbonate transport system substrate-binding protein